MWVFFHFCDQQPIIAVLSLIVKKQARKPTMRTSTGSSVARRKCWLASSAAMALQALATWETPLRPELTLPG